MAKLIEITGKALSGEWGSDDETGSGIPVLRTTNFTNDGIVNYDNVITRIITKRNLDEKFLRKGDIIIEKSGGSDKQPVGRVVYFDGLEKTYLCNNFTGLLRVRDTGKWHPRFVFYALYVNYRQGGTRSYENKTTGLHNLKTDDYVSRFVIKEASMQRQIATCSALDKAQSIIALRKQQLSALDTLIKARFVEMFGDVETNWMGWKKEPLRSHIDMITGYPFDSSSYVEKGIRICGGLIILPDRIKWDECKYWSSVDGYEQFLLASNDIVVALDRPWITDGFKIGTISEADLPALLIQRTARIRGIDMAQSFVLYLLKDNSFEQHCTVTGSLVPHISNKDINSYQVIVPPIDLQNQFAAFVSQVDKSKAAVQKALDEAQLLFDSLMQKYFG